MSFNTFRLLLSALLLTHGGYALGRQDSLKAHTDFLYQENKQFKQDLFLLAPEADTVGISLKCFYYTEESDSVLIYHLKLSKQLVNPGAGKFTLAYPGKSAGQFLLPAFARVLQRTGLVPVGTYKLFLNVTGKKLGLEKTFLHEQDSVLDMNSSLRKGIINALLPANRKASKFLPIEESSQGSGRLPAQVLQVSQFRLKRYLKKKGLRAVHSQESGKEVLTVYSDNWCVGRYVLQPETPFYDQVLQERNALENNIGAFATSSFTKYNSLMSQFRDLKKSSREHREISGEIALSANFSSDQEVFSELDNNYYELTGTLEFPVLDIPIRVSGYYTTQDQHRPAKSSYFHVRYNAEKAKEKLIKLISAYDKRYLQTIAEGGNYKLVYGQYIQQLKTKQASALASLKQEAGIDDYDSKQFDPAILEERAKAMLAREEARLKDSLLDQANSTAAVRQLQEKAELAREAKAKAQAYYDKSMQAYARLKELEQQIERYQTLLEQYDNTLYFDSLMAYSKLGNLEDLDKLSYKDLSRKAAEVLPEGKVKRMATGLTRFEAGIFPDFISDYTMSGQMLKGVDAGYDIGFAELGVSYGKTEFVDRDGQVEGYKTYSGRLKFKPVLQQQFGVVYYGYTPGRDLVSDSRFFKGTDVSLPSFRNPVHILAATYHGGLSKYLIVDGEYAASRKQGQSPEASGLLSARDQSAYNVNLSGNIPYTTLNIEAGYAFAGSAFENTTLPVLMAGTERFRVAGKGVFFRSFLSLGMEYNYLLQSSFSSQGKNARWGFNIRTHSKRFPSLYLSYKPFSSFRTFNDTLNIEQKPIVGSVWTGRLSYQLKKLNRALRFSLVLNQNSSLMDTVAYESSVIQWNTIYTHYSTMLALNLGYTRLHTDGIETTYPAFNNGWFANIMLGGNIRQHINLNGGIDLATSAIGLSRYGLHVGGNYSFKKFPVMLRANVRYSNYRLEVSDAWQPLYSGGLELAWRFNMKLSDE